MFDPKTNRITKQGGGRLTQCSNLLRGHRLQVEKTTGLSRGELDQGRVQANLAQACGSSGQQLRPGSPRNRS